LAASDEKDLPTSQPPTQTDSRFPGADGHAGRTQGAQAPARERSRTAGDLDSAQAARLGARHTPNSFAAADRLHRSAEFLRLQRRGVRYQSPHFVLYLGKLQDDPDRARLGVTVSRRIGNAVVRNRVKRRIRESFRLELRAMIPAGVSIVVIARAGAGSLASTSIRSELSASLRSVETRLREAQTSRGKSR
jgi:ribonuclease P protein component